jgi:Icc-related predicted phosphoesterase
MLVRLLCFSDLHGSATAARRLVELAIHERVDVLVSAGDLATEEVHAPDLYEVFASAKTPIVAVPGNHDGDAPYADSLGVSGFIDIDGKQHVIDGMTFAGWGIRWLDELVAGPDRRGQRPDPVLDLITNRLMGNDPARTIFVSHLPPWGVRAARDRRGTDWGNAQLRAWVERYQPAAVICGHVHEPSARMARVGRTLVVNGGREGVVLTL